MVSNSSRQAYRTYSAAPLSCIIKDPDTHRSPDMGDIARTPMVRENGTYVRPRNVWVRFGQGRIHAPSAIGQHPRPRQPRNPHRPISSKISRWGFRYSNRT